MNLRLGLQVKLLRLDGKWLLIFTSLLCDYVIYTDEVDKNSWFYAPNLLFETFCCENQLLPVALITLTANINILSYTIIIQMNYVIYTVKST